MWQVCINITFFILILVQFSFLELLSDAYSRLSRDHYMLSGGLFMVMEIVDSTRREIITSMYSKNDDVKPCNIEVLHTETGDEGTERE